MNESLRDFCQRIREVANACAEGEIIEGAIAGEWLEAQDGWLGFRKDVQYRVKHNTININGFAVPKPETEELEMNTYYYVPDPMSRDLVRRDVWGRTRSDLYALSRHLIHLTEHNAIIHAKAMLLINPYVEVEDDE